MDEPDQTVRKGLFALFVDRPVLTCMVLLTLFTVGAIAYTRLPLRFMPDGATSNRINIWIPIRTNRSPEEVRDRVVRPLEELLRTIPGVLQIRATASTNRCIVRVELTDSLDPTLAAAEVRDRLQRARLQWPDDVDFYSTWKEDGTGALAYFQILTPERSPEWDFKIDDIIQPRIEAVDGIGRVEMWGLRDDILRIWFDRDKLEAHGIDLRTLLRRLGSDNFTAPVGELDDGSRRLLVRVNSKFTSTRDIERFVVAPGLVLGDIAKVRRKPDIRNEVSRYEGKETYMGSIRGSADANPVDTMHRVRAVAEELKADSRLQGLDFRFLFDQGSFIEDSLNSLFSTAVQGGALALLALLLFLRNMRMTVAIALAIPMTLMIVGAQLYFSGGSLNIATMAGMTLAIGMVVDNSVVVLENIRRLRNLGMDLRSACIQGAREVGMPVTMATLTTVVVFLPMVFMAEQRQARVAMAGIGIPLSVALLGSLMVALLLLPSLIHMFEKRRKTAAESPRARATDPLFIAALLRVNRVMVRAGMRHRLAFLLFSILLVISAFTLGSPLEFKGGKNPFEAGDVRINLSFPRGMLIEDARKRIVDYEVFLREHGEEWRIKTISSRFGKLGGSVSLELQDSVTSEEKKELRHEIVAAWPQLPGVKVVLRERGGMMGGDDSDEQNPSNFVVRLWGRDNEFLMRMADRARLRLLGLEETENIEIPAMDRQQEVIVAVDRDRMQDLGVQSESLLGAMASGLQGRELARFEEKGQEIRLIAQFDAEEEPDLLDLKSTKVWSGGGFSDLDEVADVRFQRTVSSIESRDGRTSVVLVGSRAAGVGPRAMSDSIKRVMDRLQLPRGYGWSETSPSQDTQEELAALLQAGILSITLVFLLMGVLFESLILPLSILVTVPFALAGAFWALRLVLGTIDPMAAIGMIVLAGVVVNNGIVLLDFIERLRRQGHGRTRAILEGTQVRLRPIAMTATTTILGLLPMAVFGESGGSGLTYVGLSVAVIGGLALSTVFTPVAVPLAYVFADDVSAWLRGLGQKREKAPLLSLAADDPLALP